MERRRVAVAAHLAAQLAGLTTAVSYPHPLFFNPTSADPHPPGGGAISFEPVDPVCIAFRASDPIRTQSPLSYPCSIRSTSRHHSFSTRLRRILAKTQTMKPRSFILASWPVTPPLCVDCAVPMRYSLEEPPSGSPHEIWRCANCGMEATLPPESDLRRFH